MGEVSDCRVSSKGLVLIFMVEISLVRAVFPRVESQSLTYIEGMSILVLEFQKLPGLGTN
jgi:hypothetical protein